MHRHATRLLLLLAALNSACHFAKTDYLLETLNKPSDKPSVPVPPTPPAERIAGLTRAHLVDAYIDAPEVARWMSALGGAPEPILAQFQCLARSAGGDNSTCYQDFLRAVVTAASPWRVPAPPAQLKADAPPPAEVDAARFLANAMSIASSLAELQLSLGRPLTDAELRAGLREGAEAAAGYAQARRWHRQLRRPTNAIVMSGGGANGAFTAGAMWRLLGILEKCRGKPASEGGCGDARIDLVVGTSTGALVGTLIDLFHTPGQEKAARDLLVNNYTCTVESDLYCVNSTWVWKLADDVRGLVRFDGVYRKLREAVKPEMMDNGTELVAVSVHYETGETFTISDQDPADRVPGASPQERAEGLIQGLVASIVEPVLSEPVDWVPSKGGQVKGSFVDGGVRSGLPLLQAVQRGAERVLVISTAGLHPEAMAPPPSAFSILGRTIDLFVSQPRVGEVQQGELGAVTRRFIEYNLCQDRLENTEASDADVLTFCRRAGPGFDPPRPTGLQAAASMWMGPARFDQVASSWRSAWMYRPESGLETATGYSFSPQVMRPLFQQGARTFQQRCTEVLRLFEIHGSIAQAECGLPMEEVDRQVAEALGPVDRCTANKPEKRTCP